VASENRQSMTRRATQTVSGSSALPFSMVKKPTQEKKSCSMFLSQCALQRSSDHCPPPSDSAACRPAHHGLVHGADCLERAFRCLERRG
jgi:hypothetical protein